MQREQSGRSLSQLFLRSLQDSQPVVGVRRFLGKECDDAISEGVMSGEGSRYDGAIFEGVGIGESNVFAHKISEDLT